MEQPAAAFQEQGPERPAEQAVRQQKQGYQNSPDMKTEKDDGHKGLFAPAIGAKRNKPFHDGIQRTFNNMPESIREQLRILWKTPGYTPHAFAAHPRLLGVVVKHTADALIAMSTNEEGGNLLKNLNFNPIGSAKDEDWDDVRELGIALF